MRRPRRCCAARCGASPDRSSRSPRRTLPARRRRSGAIRTSRSRARRGSSGSKTRGRPTGGTPSPPAAGSAARPTATTITASPAPIATARRHASSASTQTPAARAMKLVCENENAMPRKITGAAAAPASTTGRRAPNTHRPVIVRSANTSTRPNRLGSNRSELTRNRSEYALAISIFAFSTIVVFANHSQIATPARISGQHDLDGRQRHQERPGASGTGRQRRQHAERDVGRRHREHAAVEVERPLQADRREDHVGGQRVADVAEVGRRAATADRRPHQRREPAGQHPYSGSRKCAGRTGFASGKRSAITRPATGTTHGHRSATAVPRTQAASAPAPAAPISTGDRSRACARPGAWASMSGTLPATTATIPAIRRIALRSTSRSATPTAATRPAIGSSSSDVTARRAV